MKKYNQQQSLLRLAEFYFLNELAELFIIHVHVHYDYDEFNSTIID